MTTTLITGANKSLGFETARRLAEAGHTIYLGSRDEQRGKEAAARIGARPVRIDVTSDDSVQAAAALIRDEAGHLDVLVNNAGISGGPKPPGDVTAADMRTVYETNVFGVVRVTHAFLPLLAASSAPVIVMVSSGLGSHERVTDPSRIESGLEVLPYPSSKSALNMVTTRRPTSTSTAARRPSGKARRSSSGWPASGRTGRPAGTSRRPGPCRGKHRAVVNT
jgi:NAD(P)-dependent dehydrogenase (short-subunit alcohol dehydrogenase family)